MRQTSKALRFWSLASLTCLQASPATAHSYIGDGGPGAGFIHPLTGPDHLLAMFTVGLLSARIGGSAIWTIPASFLVGMTVGGTIGLSGAQLPAAGVGVAASVLFLGILLTYGPAAPTGAIMAVAAAFGVFHGYAHGTEALQITSPLLYVGGFLVATAGLHVMGAISGLLIQCRERAEQRLRLCGIGIAVIGACFLLPSRLVKIGHAQAATTMAKALIGVAPHG